MIQAYYHMGNLLKNKRAITAGIIHCQFVYLPWKVQIFIFRVTGQVSALKQATNHTRKRWAQPKTCKLTTSSEL